MKSIIILFALLISSYSYSIPIQISNDTDDIVYVWVKWNTSYGADCSGFWSMHCIPPHDAVVYDTFISSARPVVARVWDSADCEMSGTESVRKNDYYSCTASTVVAPYTLTWHDAPPTSFGLNIIY